MRRLLRGIGLSLALAVHILLFWAAQAGAGWLVCNEETIEHGHIALGGCVRMGHFCQAMGESWERKFLQMAVCVVLTSRLRRIEGP